MNSLARCKCCNVVQWVPLDQLNQRATFTPEAFEYLCPVCQRTTFFALIDVAARHAVPASGGGA